MSEASMVQCPRCGTQVASHNLSRHERQVHPNGLDQLARHKGKIFLGTAVAGILAVVFLAMSSPPAERADLTGRWVGREAPDFALPTVDGGSFTLSESRGSPVLLFFNEGLMCAPCLRQMIDMDADDARFAALGVQQVALTTDPRDQLARWASSNGVSTLIVASDQTLEVDRTYETLGRDVSMMAGTRAGHTYLLVDKAGVVLWRADYGPGVMYVKQDEIYNEVRQALEG